MNKDLDIQIEKFLRNEMSREELFTFEEQLLNNPELSRQVNEYKEVFDAFEHFKSKNLVAEQLELVSHQDKKNTDFIAESFSAYAKRYWRTAAVAATVAILASGTTFFISKQAFLKQDQRRITQLVNKDIRKIKKKQAALEEDIEDVQNNVVPDYPSQFAGTAFALSKNGYAITNLHVIAGGSKVFIFPKDGKGYKCDVVHRDKENDVAILKVLKEDFTFGNSAIPYQFKEEAVLAQEVFSLGYPKNEVVYNKGYVSSMNGRDGDSTKYQLELPSSPGVSGSPVLDQSGNIIGIINSKESISKGITYAIKSSIVKTILEEMPDENFNNSDISQNRFSSMNRSAQIKELEDFIFLVKVYK